MPSKEINISSQEDRELSKKQFSQNWNAESDSTDGYKGTNHAQRTANMFSVFIILSWLCRWNHIGLVICFHEWSTPKGWNVSGYTFRIMANAQRPHFSSAHRTNNMNLGILWDQTRKCSLQCDFWRHVYCDTFDNGSQEMLVLVTSLLCYLSDQEIPVWD